MADQFFLENKLPLSAQKNYSEKILLEEDTFRLISDWYYLAILNLALLKENSSNPKWISERLGLGEVFVDEALKRLYRLNLLENKEGRLFRTSKALTTTMDIPSAAIRKHHGQNLILAEKALHNEPVGRRDFGSITMAVNPEKLVQAKELLLRTREKIGDLLSEGDASEVYTLSFQLFPLTK